MKVELFYLPDCPNYGPVVNTLKEVLRESGLPEEITEVAIVNSAQAVALSFPGSPTVRVDGRDVEAGIPALTHFGLSCRTYVVNGRLQGIPEREWIRNAVASARGRRTDNPE